MTDPTTDDLRAIAEDLSAPGHWSKPEARANAEKIQKAADRIDELEAENKRLRRNQRRPFGTLTPGTDSR